MNKWIKKSISLAMLTAMCTVDVCGATAQAESANYVEIDNEQITLDKAQELALAHAVGVAQQNSDCSWNQGFCIKSSKMLFHQNFFYLYKNDPLYKNIRYHDWNSTYTKLFKYMKTKTDEGTWDDDMLAGLDKYVKRRGYTVKSCKLMHTDAVGVVNQINIGLPVLLSLNDSACYDDHTVLALGYDTFKYSNGDVSRYIRIVDGWSCRANRFIWDGTTG